MIFSTGSIQVEIGALSDLKNFLSLALKEVKSGKITQNEFINAIESCLEESILAQDDCVVIRASAKG